MKLKPAIRFAVWGLLFTPWLLWGAFTADLSKGEVTIKLESQPDKISPAREVMLTFTVEAPSYLKVAFPDLQDRFSGFSLAEDFATDPIEANGRVRQTYRWRLIPEPAAKRYRLAPFAVATEDTRTVPAKVDSFATVPVVFPDEGPRPVVTGDPEVTLEAEWIPPTAKTVTLWGLLLLAGIALLAALVYGISKISTRVKEARMSPVERAMAELRRLLGRNLPQRGLFKEFYIELTAVVRRYIERCHGIRAPKLTTEEFLAAAANHADFPPEALASLRTFLESADLVKFAGRKADGAMADEATDRARNYLTEDAKAVAAAAAAGETRPATKEEL